MSVHQQLIRLAHVGGEQDLEQCAQIMADGSQKVAQFLGTVARVMGNALAYYNLLRMLDAKHLYGERIYQLCFKYFDGRLDEPFFNHIYDRLPCQRCDQLEPPDQVFDRYDRLTDSLTYFAALRRPELRQSEEMLASFGPVAQTDPAWECHAYQQAKTPRLFRHRCLEPAEAGTTLVALELGTGAAGSNQPIILLASASVQR